MLFKGKYEFLSNFYPCVISLDGITYPSTEHAYQAMKSGDSDISLVISKLDYPGQAKKYGQQLVPQKNWDEVKVASMKMLLNLKFNDYELATKLVDVEEDLVENNWWHDNFWGHCLCEACVDIEKQNNLGKLLAGIKKQYSCSNVRVAK